MEAVGCFFGKGGEGAVDCGAGGLIGAVGAGGRCCGSGVGGFGLEI